MPIFVGGKKQKFISGSSLYDAAIYDPIPITNGAVLLTSDNLGLRSSSSVRLTGAEYIQLLTSENYTIQDTEDLYLKIIKKG